jgi:hypothetical protein
MGTGIAVAAPQELFENWVTLLFLLIQQRVSFIKLSHLKHVEQQKQQPQQQLFIPSIIKSKL